MSEEEIEERKPWYVSGGGTPQKYIPFEWEGVVCTCPDPIYADGWAEGPKGVCLLCNKIARYLLIKCVKCHEDFLYWFTHHARVRGKGWCWNCICEVDPPIEGDKPPTYTKAPRTLRAFDEVMADTEFEEIGDFLL